MSEPVQPSEEELRAAYEAELKRISTADVIVQTAVSLINLAGRRLGLAPGAEDERDLEQVRDAIDAVRGLMPVLERHAGPEIAPLRDALAQLQMGYAREAQAAGIAPGAGDKAPEPGSAPSGPDDTGGPAEGGGTAGERSGGSAEPGPAQRSGRLWVPGS